MNFKQLRERWRTDYDFKTYTTAFGSMLVTILFALYNGYLGAAHGSAWHGGICCYYLLLIGIRVMALTARPARRETDTGRRFLWTAALLMLINLCLVAPFALMVKQEKPVSLTLIPAIAMAAFTVYKVTAAAVNMRRRRQSAEPTVRLLRTISFVDALVSVVTLQNTLIMVNTRESSGQGMLPLTAVTSGVIWLVILLLTAGELIRGIRAAGVQ